MTGALSVTLFAGCYNGLDADLPLDLDPAESGPDSVGDDGDDSGDSGGDQTGCEPVGVGAAGLRWLSRDEYTNTIRDLLFIETDVVEGFPDDSYAGSFATNSLGTVSQFAVEQYMFAAEELAAQAPMLFLQPCFDQTPACATQFIEELGRRAYRRPLAPNEVDAFVDLWADGAAEVDFDHGLRLVIRALLQSPDFLYLVEVGSPVAGDPELVELTPYEVASRLSYFLWNSMPDDTLLDAAEAGGLHEADDVAAQVERMLHDPRMRYGLRDFHLQWLGLERLGSAVKDPDLYPDFGPELVSSMLAEVDAFASHVVQDGDGRLETLLTAPYSYVDAPLAQLYGVSLPDAGGGPHRIDFDPQRRAGLLTQAGLMTLLSSTDESSIVARGKFVREQVVCQLVAEVPDDVNTDLPPPDPLEPPRQRFEEHVAAPECRACHQLMDPLGFGFEHYDAIGRWRDEIGAWPVDALGELVGTDQDGPFDGAVQLADRLAASDDVHRCLATQWLRFAVARELAKEDGCARDEIEARFLDTRGDLRELIAAIATSDLFRYRRLPKGQE